MGNTHDTLLVTHGKFRKISLVSAVENIISSATLVPWSIGIDLQRHDDGCILLNGAPRGNETEDEDVSHEGFHLILKLFLSGSARPLENNTTLLSWLASLPPKKSPSIMASV